MIYVLKKRHLKAISEGKIKMIPINAVFCKKMPLNYDTTLLIESIQEGYAVPPIDVHMNDKGQYIVKDGRHRFVAHKMLDKTHVMCHIRH